MSRCRIHLASAAPMARSSSGASPSKLSNEEPAPLRDLDCPAGLLLRRVAHVPPRHTVLFDTQADGRLEVDARMVAADAPATPDTLSVESVTEEDPAAYLERVRRAKEYVRAGDIYQANLSRPWRVELSREPDIGALYNRLCKANPAPF